MNELRRYHQRIRLDRHSEEVPDFFEKSEYPGDGCNAITRVSLFDFLLGKVTAPDFVHHLLPAAWLPHRPPSRIFPGSFYVVQITVSANGAKPCANITFSPELGKGFHDLKESLRRQFCRKVLIFAQGQKVQLHIAEIIPENLFKIRQSRTSSLL